VNHARAFTEIVTCGSPDIAMPQTASIVEDNGALLQVTAVDGVLE
jgi:hypothetical protein